MSLDLSRPLALVTLAGPRDAAHLTDLLAEVARTPHGVRQVVVLDAGVHPVLRLGPGQPEGPTVHWHPVPVDHYRQFPAVDPVFDAAWAEVLTRESAVDRLLWPVDLCWPEAPAPSTVPSAPGRPDRQVVLLPVGDPLPAAQVDPALTAGRRGAGLAAALGVPETCRVTLTGVRPPAPEDEQAVAARLARVDELVREADFEGALDLARTVVALPGGLGSAVLLTLARVLRATSRYREAAEALTVAAGDPTVAARATAEAAEVAWLVHDDARAEQLAVQALRVDPTHRKAISVRDRARRPQSSWASTARRPGALTHVAFYVSEGGNYGDVALPVAVRNAVEHVGGARSWVPVHAHRVFDRGSVDLANQSAGVVVGGGGLFLPDTSPNGVSGWQWNVPPDSLDRLEVPLGVVAVGYNLFAGQSFRGDLFRQNLVRLVDRAAFVGLRNHGSVRQVRELLPEHLAEKVTFLPCPTTVLERTDPDLPEAVTGTGRVLLNVAYDRSERRFAEGYDQFLAQMAGAVGRLRAEGAEVGFAAHLPSDERFVTDLRRAHGLRLDSLPLYATTLREGYAEYRRASLVIGMRGHATMIPFGLGTPVMSVISHPKMAYFLQDVGRPAWGVDVADPDLGRVLSARAGALLADEVASRADVQDRMDLLLAPVTEGVRTFLAATA